MKKINQLNNSRFTFKFLIYFSFFILGINENLIADKVKDSLYLRSIQTKSTYWEDRDLDSSNYYSRFQFNEALKLKNEYFISTAYNQLGCNAKRAGKLDSALYFFKKAEEKAKPFDIHGAYPSIIYNKSMLFRITNQLDSAIIMLKEVLRCDFELKNFKLISGTLNELGNCMIANDETLEGFKYYVQSYQVASHLKDTLMMGGLSINMASQLLNLKLKKESKKMALNSLYWFELAQNNRGMSYAYNLLAQFSNDHLDESLKYRKLALTYGLKSNDVSHLASIYEGLGFHYYSKKQLDSSIYYHTIAIENRRNIGEIRLLSSSYFNIASVYFEKGLLTEAKRNLDSLYALPQQGNTEVLYLGHRLNAQVDSSLGDFKGAHLNLLAALEHQELYFNDESKTELLRHQTNLENQKKELTLKNSFLSKELMLNSKIYAQKRQRTYLISAVISIILIFIGVYYYLTRKQRERELKLKLQLFKSEMDGLESQINTHFIYNTLSVIQRFIYQNMTDMAISSLNQFANLLRISLTHSRNGFATLESELEAIRLFCELEAYNFDDAPTFAIEIDSEILADQIKIPPMLIQPLVENAFKHGISSQPDKGKIWIQVVKESEFVLKVTIRDNGPELSPKKGTSGLSFSSGIILDRLNILNRQHKTNIYTLELKSENYLNLKTTIAEIKLPIAA